MRLKFEQRIAKFLGALEAAFGRFFQRLLDDSREPFRDVRTQSYGGQRFLFEMPPHNGVKAVPLKRMAAGHALIKRRAQRVEVRPYIERLRFELFGRHVVKRPQRRSRRGELGVPRLAGNAKISELHHAAGRNQDVRRLDVAMNHAEPVCVRERRKHLTSAF